MKRYKAIAEYYDAEHARTAWLEEDVPFLLKHLPKRRQQILELGTGTGRAAIPLAQAGHRVVGVDYDPDMLAIARRKRDAVGLGHRDLELIEADALDLDLPRRFDWIVLLFNTFLNFTTLDEQDRLLQTIRRHLKPRGRGRFWLDIFQPDPHRLAQEVSTNLDPCAFHVPALDRTVFQMTEVRRDLSRQLQHVIFHYTWFDEHGVAHHQRSAFDMTWVFPRELQILLERNGLAIERLWGDYNGRQLRSDSPRMIARCNLM